MADRQQDYITEARIAAKQLWEASNKLKALQQEWDSLDYGTTLVDGSGDNSGYTAVEVGAVVFATTDALFTLYDSGHGTNIATLL